MRASSEQSGGGEAPGEAAATSLAPTPSATPTVPLASSTPAVVDSAATPWLDKPTVKMEGYLEKKGKMRVVAMWKRYWFVLEGRLLLYYKSQQEYARLSPCRGSLNMGLASCVRPGAHTGAGAGLGAEQHVLEVVLRSHVVSLRAKDRACQERWLQALLDSMASSSATSPGRDPGKGRGQGQGRGHGKGQGPLHFRYPSADNLSKACKADQDHGRGNIREEEDAPQSGHSEKRHTLPNWKRTPSTELMLVTVPEKAVPSGGTPNLIQDKLPEDLHIAPRKAQAGKTGGINLTRQGSILPILGKKDKTNKHSSPQAIHPINTQDSPFGSQRYSFHGFQKVGDDGSDSASKKDRKDLERSCKSKGFRNFESVLKKQLSFSSPSSAKDVCTKNDSFVGTPIMEDVLKATNGCAEKSLNCKFCHSRNIEGGRCICQNMGTPELEEEKENLNIRRKIHLAGSKKYRPDENQNQLFQDSLETTKMPVSLGKNQSSSEKDLLITSGVDLSPERKDPKPIRCTSADQLWSAPRKSFGEIHVKHSKFDQMGPDAQYFSASDIRHPCNTLDSHRSEPIATDKSKLVKLSIRQRLLHGNGEYIKYSEPEDCDKRDSTLNTTTDSQPQDSKAKQKMRMRKRKGSSSKDSYSLADSNDGKKRAPVRNRLSFLTRVLSHVRRAKSEDIMDHPETEGIFSDDAFLSPHPDMHSKCSTPVSRVLDDVKKMEDTPSGSSPLGTNFQLGPSNPVFGEAPEEPPPDYDSVGVEQLNNSAGCSVGDIPPQLPPRRTKRPRSPWHDVPTNNSPVIDMDNDARLRLLSAAKYGRVIGTRTSNAIDFYDWSDSHPSDNSQHHAYEVVSDDPSTPAGSNEHLAIYLSSESSDEEFHEEMVLRRNIQDREFLFGSEGETSSLANFTKSSAMEPLTICTNILPTLDSSGRVGLSHVEAVKLNLLMQAQRTSTESIRRRRGEHDDQDCSKPLKTEENVVVVKSYPISNNCLQQPPEEFADKEDLPLITATEASEKVMDSVKGLLAPIEKPLHICEGSVVDSELNSIIYETGITKVEEVKELILSNNILDEPPQLPSKKMKGIWKPDDCEPDSRHSDELNDLLAQLAGMTTAPLLPVGAGCSLQINQVHGVDGEVTTVPTAVKKQSLSLDAFANMYDSEPDYDVPRPHASLLHILPQNGRTFQNYRPGDDDIVVEATHFFSRPESPRHVAMDDQSLNGHMSPDSLDFPFTPRRASTWEPCYSNTGNGQDRPQTQKARPKKDRNRRATLSGPLIHQTGEPTPYHPAPLVRRNSMELPLLEADAEVYACSMNQKERGMTEPKQVKMLSTHDVTCEHNSSPLSSFSQSHTPCIGEVCKKIEISTSLEDISEKSELNSDSISSRHIINPVSQARTLPRPDELDMDSLEASEFKKVDVPELITTALLSIVEEPDTLSERSDKCSEGTGQSSGSTSEGAVMFDGNSSATDQQTHNTDTEMEMPSDDEMGHFQDQNTLDDVRRVIEPDSLLPEPFAVGNGEQNNFGQMVESDSTKDASLETDSLELKK